MRSRAAWMIIPVARLDDVVSRALVRKPVPIVWEEDTKVPGQVRRHRRSRRRA